MVLYFVSCLDTKYITWHMVSSFLNDRAKCALHLPSDPTWSTGFKCVWYDCLSAYASKTCNYDGTWYTYPKTNKIWTNYTMCYDKSLAAVRNFTFRNHNKIRFHPARTNKFAFTNMNLYLLTVTYCAFDIFQKVVFFFFFFFFFLFFNFSFYLFIYLFLLGALHRSKFANLCHDLMQKRLS